MLRQRWKCNQWKTDDRWSRRNPWSRVGRFDAIKSMEGGKSLQAWKRFVSGVVFFFRLACFIGAASALSGRGL